MMGLDDANFMMDKSTDQYLAEWTRGKWSLFEAVSLKGVPYGQPLHGKQLVSIMVFHLNILGP